MTFKLLLSSLLLNFTMFSSLAQAQHLAYKGIDLDAVGIHKGVQLPSDPGTSLFGLTFVTGAEGIREKLPTNAILFFPIVVSQWASGSYDASGKKVAGVGNISATALLLRPLYIWPAALQPHNKHLVLTTDFVLPAMVNIHVDAGPPGTPQGVGVGGASVGDISFAPVALVWKGYKKPWIDFSGYVSVLFNFPTGSYSNKNVFNVGSNEKSFTVLTNPILTFSRLKKLYWDQELQFTHTMAGNDSFVLDANPLTNIAYTGLPMANYTTGDLLTYNTDVLYRLTKSFALGPSVAVMKQISDDTWNHIAVQNSSQFSVAPGVGLQYAHSGLNFQVKYIGSVSAKNGPRYNVVWAQFSIPFTF